MQLDMAEQMSMDSMLLMGCDAASSAKHDYEVYHLPPSVESTLASLPYDNLYFPSCTDDY